MISINPQPGDRPAHILLVDDEPLILDTIGMFLEDEGCAITMAGSGAQALVELSNAEFDAIVTDLSMPGTHGFEVMAAAKTLQPDTPVIVLTGLGTLDNAVKAIQHGAYDFVTKPVHDLTVFLITIQRALDKRNMLLTQKAYLAQIERQNLVHVQDLEAARRIQACMINRNHGLAARYLDITARYQPADNIGGDFYDLFFIRPGLVGFYMADVAGHGVSAAMVTAVAKQTIGNIVEKAVEELPPEGPSPREILMKFNAEMRAQGFERDGVPMYLTLFFGLYDSDRQRIRYSNGGHAPVPRRLSPGGELVPLYLEGNPVGLFDQPYFDEKELPIETGDRLFLCTDGVVEARGRHESPYGLERLDRRLAELAHEDSDAMADGVVRDVMAYIDPEHQADDISILVLSPAKKGGPGDLDGPA